MKAKKVLALVLCAALLVAGSVAATLAYLMSTDTVTNTFTVGKVVITLDEAEVDLYGDEVEGADRRDNNQYKLIPGHNYKKDPIIHVEAGSEKCYLFAKIENGLGSDATINGMTGWTAIAEGSNVYYYAQVVDAGAAAQDVTVFTDFTFGAEANPETHKDHSIVVTAYAVQYDGFESGAVAAWNATYGKPANS